MIEAIIFDLDGVIVDSEAAHIEAEKQTFLKFNVLISEEELHKFTGVPSKEMFAQLIVKFKIRTTVDEIKRMKEEILFRLLERDAEPTKGILDLLNELRRRRIKLALGSSSTRTIVYYVLKKLGIISLFDCIITAEDVELGKPDPETFLKAAEKLGVDPRHSLVVEDAELGVEAAKRAGMKCIGYKNVQSGKQDLSSADIITDDLSTLDISKIITQF